MSLVRSEHVTVPFFIDKLCVYVLMIHMVAIW